MKIFICFPPLQSDKGYPTLGQNRQFQYFKEPTYIYPVVPAIAATLLKKEGFEVEWVDCIAQNISYNDFLKMIKGQNPDLIVMETKTPLIKKQWKLVDEIKGFSNAKMVFFGDHVTALPEESMSSSNVDFVLTGGDYDFLLLNLCNWLKNKNDDINFLEPGIWYRKNKGVENTGFFTLNHDLNRLPFIDRQLTKWKLYAYKNGNYRRTPGTYIMSGRDCWWGKCTFCSWPQLYPTFRSRTVDNVIEEIDYLVNQLGVKEIMDDTGTFPVGSWLEEFCNKMIEKGLNKKVTLDCNMRFGAVDFNTYKLMQKAGFRFLLFGIESVNEDTLKRIKKDTNKDIILQSCKQARKAGLYPHITIMFGYPWESYQDAKNTLEFGKFLLKKDYAYTMQATVVIPYPGTPLFKECKEKNWLYSSDWEYYDMKNAVMKLSFDSNELLKLVQSMYSVSFDPEFVIRKILSIKSMDDVKYFSRAAMKVFGHIIDFAKKKHS